MHRRKQFILPEIFHMYKTGSVVVISVAFVDFIAFVVFVGVF